MLESEHFMSTTYELRSKEDYKQLQLKPTLKKRKEKRMHAYCVSNGSHHPDKGQRTYREG